MGVVSLWVHLGVDILVAHLSSAHDLRQSAIRSGKLLSFKSFRNVLAGLPFFECMIVLVVRLERPGIG